MTPDLAAWPPSREGIEQALLALNRLRMAEPLVARSLDHALEPLFRASTHLIVYGSLAPGRPNHGQLSALQGHWTAGWVTGALMQHGWGAAHGYPALRWSPGGDRVPASLFVSLDLPHAWPRLDEFEGSDYRRILVPFFRGERLVAVGNLYAAAELGSR